MASPTPPKNGTNKTAERAWDMPSRVTVILMVAVCSTLIMHEVRIAKIEESRFTDSMGLALESNLKAHIAANYPPEWLREDMVEIKGLLKSLEVRIRTLEDRINSGK